MTRGPCGEVAFGGWRDWEDGSGKKDAACGQAASRFLGRIGDFAWFAAL
jgi:hypothetical protein